MGDFRQSPVGQEQPSEHISGWYSLTPWLRVPVAYLVCAAIPMAALVVPAVVKAFMNTPVAPPRWQHTYPFVLATLFAMGVVVAFLAGGRWYVHGIVVGGLMDIASIILLWTAPWPEPIDAVHMLSLALLGFMGGIPHIGVVVLGALLGGYLARRSQRGQSPPASIHPPSAPPGRNTSLRSETRECLAQVIILTRRGLAARPAGGERTGEGLHQKAVSLRGRIVAGGPCDRRRARPGRR